MEGELRFWTNLSGKEQYIYEQMSFYEAFRNHYTMEGLSSYQESSSELYHLPERIRLTLTFISFSVISLRKFHHA